MKGRKKIPDSLKTLRGTDQPCRMSNSVAIPPTTAVVALPRTGLKAPRRRYLPLLPRSLSTKACWMLQVWIWSWRMPARWRLYHDLMRDVEREGVQPSR